MWEKFRPFLISIMVLYLLANLPIWVDPKWGPIIAILLAPVITVVVWTIDRSED